MFCCFPAHRGKVNYEKAQSLRRSELRGCVGFANRLSAARSRWPEPFAEKWRGILGTVRVQLNAMKLEEIVAEASKLSEEERASLASQLLHRLETPVYSVSDEEVRRRVREAEADPSVLITFDQLVAGLRHRGS
jgi:hypothetical protein